MLEAGEIKASHVEMMHAVITPANHNVLLEGIKGKGRREVEAFMRRVTAWGEVLPENEVQVEVKMTLTSEEAAVLERAREILAAAGKVPAVKAVLMKALTELVERRDQVKKAERAAARAEKTSAARQMVSRPRAQTSPHSAFTSLRRYGMPYDCEIEISAPGGMQMAADARSG